MYHILSILTLLSITSLSADPGTEPPLNYILTIGDKAFSINENKPFEVNTIEGKHQAKLTPASYRIFPYQDVSFKYPRYLSFEANITQPNYKAWTLTGNKCHIKLSVFRQKPNEKQLTAEQLAKLLTKRFDEDKTKFSSKNIALGKKTYKCVRANIEIAGNNVIMEVISLPMSEGWTKCLLIQWLQDEPTFKEYSLIMKMLESSFSENTKPSK